MSYDVLKNRLTNGVPYTVEAAKVRAQRDRLLAETDREMCLDRLGLEVPEGISFSEWLSFFRKLGAAVIGDMARYRQELRDIPKQEGFPYSVVFPTITRHDQ